jgi:hypothetical protein
MALILLQHLQQKSFSSLFLIHFFEIYSQLAWVWKNAASMHELHKIIAFFIHIPIPFQIHTHITAHITLEIHNFRRRQLEWLCCAAQNAVVIRSQFQQQHSHLSSVPNDFMTFSRERILQHHCTSDNCDSLQRVSSSILIT